MVKIISGIPKNLIVNEIGPNTQVIGDLNFNDNIIRFQMDNPTVIPSGLYFFSPGEPPNERANIFVYEENNTEKMRIFCSESPGGSGELSLVSKSIDINTTGATSGQTINLESEGSISIEGSEINMNSDVKHSDNIRFTNLTGEKGVFFEQPEDTTVAKVSYTSNSLELNSQQFMNITSERIMSFSANSDMFQSFFTFDNFLNINRNEGPDNDYMTFSYDEDEESVLAGRISATKSSNRPVLIIQDDISGGGGIIIRSNGLTSAPTIFRSIQLVGDVILGVSNGFINIGVNSNNTIRTLGSINFGGSNVWSLNTSNSLAAASGGNLTLGSGSTFTINSACQRNYTRPFGQLNRTSAASVITIAMTGLGTVLWTGFTGQQSSGGMSADSSTGKITVGNPRVSTAFTVFYTVICRRAANFSINVYNNSTSTVVTGSTVVFDSSVYGSTNWTTITHMFQTTAFSNGDEVMMAFIETSNATNDLEVTRATLRVQPATA